MVMEASPSPQSVGREFVRQYYTLLNKAPAHLHRFYNNFSSFVHGGLDAPNRETPPVVGQKQIHNRIQQLNFRDCHAKISQVDSQATLGNGVVVQVTGELSNGGAPMRRFTQTFVLAAQSPKKYYVHNDIFRYQDIVFSEEEGEGDGGRSDGEEEAGGYFAPAASAVVAEPFPPAPPAPLHPMPPPPQHARAFDINCLSHINGHDENTSNRQLVVALQGEVEAVEEEEEASTEEAAEPEPGPAPAPLAALPPPPPEPKTYANLLKSVPLAAATPPAVHAAQAPPPRTYATQPSAPEPAAPRAPRPARPPRVDNQPPPSAESVAATVAAGATGAGGRRYSDSQQLFLGNLPSTATEEDLRALFGRFGAIAELRVHAKTSGAALPGGRNPNYGFITYEEVQSAQNCLGAGALYFPADGPDACKLNVEEKKTRSRAGDTRGGRGGGARPLPSHRPAFPSRAPSGVYRR